MSNNQTVLCLFREDAIKYGAEPAIILYYIRYELDWAIAGSENVYVSKKTGKTYHWCSFAENWLKSLFPFIEINKIYEHIDYLESIGAIISDSHFAADRRNGTMWYTTPEYIIN